MEFSQIYQQTVEFLESVVGDRDQSHNIDHMVTVAYSAVGLASLLDLPLYTRKWVFLGALIHDVTDLKYPEGIEARQEKLEQFLIEILNQLFRPENANDVFGQNYMPRMLMIIEAVSFSKEKKAEQKRYFEEYLDENECLIRDLISDADKLEALGKVGFDRCVAYTLHRMNKTEVDDEVMANVQAHADEKLLILNEQYIVTHLARERGVRLTEELRRCLGR